ncbi:polysaccharide lyase [Aspergillus alliaceus]|uniref:Polysaccharide lyase n=1 Tax=Petromyces alliaceus TaxID=209559 RepID=A0A5N7CI83_PETAA|nr:polysaccharide lyase [Aspergillus alliaceus]
MRFQPIALPLLLSAVAQATQIFSNSGTTSGWDWINIEHYGTVEQVTDIVYKGTTALKMTQVYDQAYTDHYRDEEDQSDNLVKPGRYHAEAVKNEVYKLDDEGFYGFAFRLNDAWQFSPVQSYNIAQFMGEFPNTDCEYFHWIPSNMIYLFGDQLYVRHRTGSVCAPKTTIFSNVATVNAGEWHKVVIQAKWRADGTGYYRLWFDGVSVLEEKDVDTTIDDDRAFQFRVGIYANGWHDDGGMKGTQGTRQVWYDEIAVGTTFADAEPDRW